MNNIIESEDLNLEIVNGKGGITVGVTFKDVKKTMSSYIKKRLETKKEYLKYTRHSKKRKKLIEEINVLEKYIK